MRYTESVVVQNAGCYDLIGDRFGFGCVRTGRRCHERLTVVTQFIQGFDDVGERAMSAVLRRTVVVYGRIPAAGKLFERAHVDYAVVQVFHEVRHVTVEEFFV